MFMKLRFTLFFLTVLSFSLSAQTVSTYAGTPQSSGNTSVPANRLSAKFYNPHGVAFDSKGNMWISEKGNCVITMIIAANDEVRIRVGGIGLASFMDGSATVARFNQPAGIAVGPNDEIYVADIDNHVIRVISAYQNLGNAQSVNVFAGKHDVKAGSYTSYSGYNDGDKDNALFMFPSDVAVDASGNVYVSDRGNNVIRKIDPSGTVSTFAGQQGVSGSADGPALSATFNYPDGVFVKGNDVYVADKLNSSIRKISGGQVTTVVSGLWTPTDLYIDNNNDIYIIDLHRIWKFDQAFAGSTQWSLSGFWDANGTDARFKNVNGITGNGNSLFVADMENHVIRRITDCGGWSASISTNGYLLTANNGKSYKWFKDGNEISGASSQSYTVSSTGNYKVVVENNDGCLATSTETYINYVSINEITFLKHLEYYPNPADDKLHLKIELNSRIQVSISIQDITGKEIERLESGKIQNLNKVIDLSNLKTGLYFLTIDSEDGRISKKIMKK